MKPEEIKKGLVEAMEETSWVVEGGDAHDLQDACDMAHASMADALAYIHQLERERDALLEIVRNEADCQVCKHIKEECDGDCSFCEIEGPCACARCTTDGSHWEWAGIKEDNP